MSAARISPPSERLLAGTNLMLGEAIEGHRQKVATAISGLSRLNSGQDPRNVHQRLKAYREYSELIMDAYMIMNDLTLMQTREIEQMKGGKGSEAGRRWSERQDEALVELACEENTTMMELALCFNRTPAAISSRLTYLVGVAKVSRHVVGRITGYLDGELVAGRFDGELRP